MKNFFKSFGIFVGLFLTYILITIWPVKEFVFGDFLGNKNLIIFTNEAESRPCGGFVTLVGTQGPGLFSAGLKNSYAFENETFGPANYPLNKVANGKKFWDLGTDLDLNVCSEKFKNAYEESTEEEVKNVILVDFSTIEEVFKLYRKVGFEGGKLTHENLFATLTRTVADVDRHDEEALQTRKTPLAQVGKKLIWRTIFNPTILPRLTRIIRKNADQGKIFVSGHSPRVEPGANDFYISEWNLGGAKTSRFLKKTLKISAREYIPDQWAVNVLFTAENLGGIDEPLSQTWKGVFEFQLPNFFNHEVAYEEIEIPPGEKFEKAFVLTYSGDLPSFGIFKPRGQVLLVDVDLSLYPQKSFTNASFSTHENVGQFFGSIDGFRQDFIWEIKKDELPPFITLHEFISEKSLPEDFQKSAKGSLIAEIHFNEKIKMTPDFMAELIDRNYEDVTTTENPEFQSAKLLQDGRTLVLEFYQSKVQIDERFYLEVLGVEDLWGNVVGESQRTLIQR